MELKAMVESLNYLMDSVTGLNEIHTEMERAD